MTTELYLPSIDDTVPVAERRNLVTSPLFTVPRELRPGFDPFELHREEQKQPCPACAATPDENCLLCENTRIAQEEAK